MTNTNIINILVGSHSVGEAISKHLKTRISQKFVTNTLLMNDTHHISKDILLADLWITDIWNPEDPYDPEGFRTVEKFAGKAKVLLIFYVFYPPDLPEEGSFWITFLSDKPLTDKVKEVLNSSPPTKEDFQKLVRAWPLLGKGSSKDHNSHNRKR